MARAFELRAQMVGAGRAAAGLEAMAARAANLHRPLDRLCQHLVRKSRRILASGERGIRSRSRQLESSLTYAFHSPNEAEVGSNKVYAGSQQSGPRGGFYESSRSGGFLAVPIADNIRARQQARYSSPREVPDGFFIRPSDSPPLFVRRRKGKFKSDRLIKNRSAFHKAMAAVTAFREIFEVLFVLLTRVKDRPRTGEHQGRYVTFDEPDRQVWDLYASDWVTRGR